LAYIKRGERDDIPPTENIEEQLISRWTNKYRKSKSGENRGRKAKGFKAFSTLRQPAAKCCIQKPALIWAGFCADRLLALLMNIHVKVI